ncbi:MAG: PKD domain-containing protein, partial [Flavobacteriales bacterium]|nr:PKD domain-containing protein [Flavobacteriales bacterium]
HCTHNLSIWVPVDESLKADFETTAQVYELNNGAVTVPFYNTSEEALEFEWDFGDGTISENDPDASHIYTGEGEYAVKLIARNQDCETFVTKSITITPKQNQGQLDVNAVLSDIGVLMRFGFDTPKSVRVNAWNVLGQQLMTPIEGVYQNETIHFGERRYFAGSLIEVIDLKTGEKALIRMPVN